MTTKEKIIESAISVIQSEGTANYSLAKVAEKTGMTKAAIFYYFKNKAELTRSLISYTIDAYETVLQEEYQLAKAHSFFPFTEAYIRGNLRQLDDEKLVGLHAALIGTVVSGEAIEDDWNEAYLRDFKRLVPEIGGEQAEFVRYTIDGMWHARILGIPEFANEGRKSVAEMLLSIVKQK
ncbi:TetR/AcrR family transcriptional regulator [Listeria aquatica]|uniref:TetR/AcrR family transcriptional regulator n=1 Tax=Listeria aquatica TaxID=1494960 RepID=A0A841ZLM1_9LIST|nr:TetR/AcrR family transcriptional regulator [Listeria aquatica]MBC1521579.1 TetR/AcrR family transcriptional regulator [Listeria aquatica]